jgi:5-formyltetrahydrofolate cyclo-ligase
MSDKISHLHPTVAHKKLYYLVICLAALFSTAVLTLLMINSRRGMAPTVWSYWRFFTMIYILLFSLVSYWLRRRGASMVHMSVALGFNCALLIWYSLCWAVYPLMANAVPRTGTVLMAGFIPMILTLPFIRSIKTAKNEFRQAAIEKRKQISRAKRMGGSIAASSRMFELIADSVKSRDGHVAVYSAVGSELSLEHLIVMLAEAGYKIAFPAIIGEGLMRFYTTVDAGIIDLQSIDLIADPMSTRSPRSLRQLKLVEPNRISVVIVPGVAFDPDGYRMGFGGGFYDRYLPKLRTTTRIFGICFDEQIYSSLPAESHDQRMDAVVTPTFIYQ